MTVYNKGTGFPAVGSGLNEIPGDLRRGPRHRLYAYFMYVCTHNTGTCLWDVYHTSNISSRCKSTLAPPSSYNTASFLNLAHQTHCERWTFQENEEARCVEKQRMGSQTPTVEGCWYPEVQHQQQVCALEQPQHVDTVSGWRVSGTSPPTGESMNYRMSFLLSQPECVPLHACGSSRPFQSGCANIWLSFRRSLERLGFITPLTSCSISQSSRSRSPVPAPCPLFLQPMQGRGPEARLTLP